MPYEIISTGNDDIGDYVIISPPLPEEAMFWRRICNWGHQHFDVKRDFNLSSDSRAIDKGDSLAFGGDKDVYGNPRILGQSVDIGAEEYDNRCEVAENCTPIPCKDARCIEGACNYDLNSSNGTSCIGGDNHNCTGNEKCLGGKCTGTAFDNESCFTEICEINYCGIGGCVHKICDTDLILWLELDNDIKDYVQPAHGYKISWSGDANYTEEGKFRQAALFDGKAGGSSIRIEDHEDLNGMEELTVSSWAKKNSLDSGGFMLFKHFQYALELKNPNTFWIDLFIEPYARFPYSDRHVYDDNITDTKWHHYSYTYDGSEVIIYIDGIEKSRADFSGITHTEDRTLYIGSNTNDAFDGAVDDVRIYTRALDSDEIYDLFNRTIMVPDCVLKQEITSPCICKGTEYSNGHCCSDGHSLEPCCNTMADTNCDKDVSLDEINIYMSYWYKCTECVSDLAEAIEAYFQ